MYSSPTIIFKKEARRGYVAVIDVSGTYAIQYYKYTLQSSGEVTSNLCTSETFNDPILAIKKATEILNEVSQ